MDEFFCLLFGLCLPGMLAEPNTLEQVYVCPAPVAQRVLQEPLSHTLMKTVQRERTCRREGIVITYRDDPVLSFIIEGEEEYYFIFRTPLDGVSERA